MSYKWFDDTYTPEGGNYYRAYAFFWASVVVIVPICVVALLVCYLNPFWFRQQLMDFIGDLADGFSQWRNYRMKAIYMGCDPKMWEALTAPVANEDAD